MPKHVRKFLDKLEADSGIEPDAISSLLNLINPFPDYAVRRVGWPDGSPVPSVVVVDTRDFPISTPSGLAAGTTWDLHASLSPQPFDTTTSFKAIVAQDGTLSSSTNNSGTFSTMKTLAAVTGTSLNPTVGSLPAGTTMPANYSYGPMAERSMHRVVAQGLELVNTTSELYKGGMVYCYRMPSGSEPITVNNNLGTAATTLSAGDLTAAPPSAPSDIVNYANTYEGPASEGAYLINTPSTSRPKIRAQNCRSLVYSSSPGTPNGSVTYMVGSGANDMCLAGIFATGLAQGSSFVLRMRTYIEIFPAPYDANNLINLANPTTPFNARLEELMSEVIATMPAGCPYTHNPLGEWFNDLMNKIQSYAPKIGAVFGPAGSLIGNGVGALARGARKLNGGKRRRAPNRRAIVVTPAPQPAPNRLPHPPRSNRGRVFEATAA